MDSPHFTEGAQAPRVCAGCEKPFGVARKPRAHATHAFISTDPASAGRAGSVPVLLCGVCARQAFGEGGSPFKLPAMGRAAEQLEALVLADRAGALQ